MIETRFSIIKIQYKNQETKNECNSFYASPQTVHHRRVVSKTEIKSHKMKKKSQVKCR